MTAKMTDAEIDQIRLDDGMPYIYRHQFREGFQQCENILLPKTQQLQIENTHLKCQDEISISQIQQLQWEIDRLNAQVKVDLDQIESWKSSSTRWCEKVDELTAKHERLVKISEDILNAMVKDDVDDMFEAEKELRKLLTESEDGK